MPSPVPARLRLRLAVALALVGLAVASPVAAQAQAPGPVAGVLIPFPDLGDFLGGSGPDFDAIKGYVADRADAFAGKFREWGRELYILLFALQFVLIGLNLVIRGPFALATSRSIHPLNPFSNLIFFYFAGIVGYLFVYYAGPNEETAGWVGWFFTLFKDTGEEVGCSDPGGLIDSFFNACDPGVLMDIGTRIAGAIMVFSDATGLDSNDPFSWLLQGLGSTTVIFAAYSILAVQLALTESAFILMTAAAPLFIATLVFRPLSGISSGFLKLMVYLSVKIFILYLVAGVAGFIGNAWVEGFIKNLIIQLIFSGGAPEVGDLLSANFSMTATALFLIALTLYLPARVAGFVAGSLNFDLHAMLFNDQSPIPF